MRDALGAALPVGVPEAFTEPVRDPLGDLVSRFARTHGPFVAPGRRRPARPRASPSCRRRWPGSARRAGSSRASSAPAAIATEWCDAEVLRAIRRRSLAALRKEVEPVPPEALARFMPAWQGLGARSARGVDGLLRAVEQLAGVPLPASALETLVLPSRVADYSPALLDELTLAGEVVWAGAGSLAGNDGWIALAPGRDRAAGAARRPTTVDDPLAAALRDALRGDEALFFRSLADRAIGRRPSIRDRRGGRPRGLGTRLGRAC